MRKPWGMPLLLCLKVWASLFRAQVQFRAELNRGSPALSL